MKQVKILMGMPITVEIIGPGVSNKIFKKVFDYFRYVDKKFSTYKKNSEISLINSGKLKLSDASPDMQKIFSLAEQTKQETDGYFNITHPSGKIDPSGLVKGWAIHNAAGIIKQAEFHNFYIDAGGDIEACGKNDKGQDWVVGIRNPFNFRQIVKAIVIDNQGVATSGNYERGQHIYNPVAMTEAVNDVVSLTVVGPNIYEVDRFATAAFAMGRQGINFIESLRGFEGYLIDKDGIATLTSGFEEYCLE